MKQRGLGKGFDALLPEALDMATFTRTTGESVVQVPVAEIVPNKSQPRRHFDKEALSQLAASIEEHGILQPLILARKDGQYQIVAGERRWRAAQLAGLTSVPALVRSASEQQKVELALIENVQREDLNPIEQAISIVRLREEFHLSYEDIAKRLGKAYPTIVNLARLLQLPKEVIEAVEAGSISEGHARAILSLKHQPRAQEELLQQIVRHGWSVRQAEQFSVAHKRAKPADKPVNKKGVSEQDAAYTKQLSHYVKLPVRIARRARGGRLIIDFKNDDDLDRISSRLAN